MANYLVQEVDGTSKFTLEDSSGSVLLETSPDEIDPSFIASATAVYTPTLVSLGFVLGFIASATQTFAPTLTNQSIAPPFIASATVVYGPYTNPVAFITAGSFSFVVPAGILSLTVQCFGGGGGGGESLAANFGGGGGGAFAADSVPVTPGHTYTGTVGAAGVRGDHFATPTVGGDSSFTGDSGVTVVAKGGGINPGSGNAPGGSAAASTGSTKHNGGNGGAYGGSNGGGGGGGGAGAQGDGGVGGPGGVGGGGAGGIGGSGSGILHGGAGGAGGYGTGTVGTGQQPGGGGGAGGLGSFFGANGAVGQVVISWGLVEVPFIATATQVFAPSLNNQTFTLPFIASTTQAYTPTLLNSSVVVPFIPSVTQVFTPTLVNEMVSVPFIASVTQVYELFIDPTDHVSQVAVETARTQPGAAYISQSPTEVVGQITPAPGARVSQSPAEVVTELDRDGYLLANISQLAVEVLCVGTVSPGRVKFYATLV